MKPDLSIEHNSETKLYFGSTNNQRNTRYCHQEVILTNKYYSNTTALSAFSSWGIKTDNYTPLVNWDLIARTKPFKLNKEKCTICLLEEKTILKQLDNHNRLNKRSELIITCSHRISPLKYLVTG